MRRRSSGTRQPRRLLTVFAAAALLATILVSSPGAAPLSVPARWSGQPATLTFSPHARLARLDLRTHRVQILRLRGFYSLADPELSGSGQLAFVSSKCASCQPRLAVLRGGRVGVLGHAASIVWVNRRTIIASVRDGDGTELRLVRLSHGVSRKIVWFEKSARGDGIESERELTVTPDGHRLIFSGEGSLEHHLIFVADLLHRRLSRLAGEAVDSPDVSPDGRTLAYQQVSRSGTWDICAARLSSRLASSARCYADPRGDDRDPAFLPNGREVVFSSDRAARRNAISALYVLDLRTGAVHRLTPAGYDAGAPAVAPDGRSVIFVRRTLVRLH